MRFTRRLRFPAFRTSFRDLVRSLTLRELLPLALAIFTLFAVLGVTMDVMVGGTQPLAIVLATSAMSGTIAIAYAFGWMRRGYLLIAGAVVLQLAWIRITQRLLEALPGLPPEDVPRRLTFDGSLTLLLVMGSYSCFLWFMNGTAARYLRVRAEIDLAHKIHQVLVPAVATTIGEFEFAGFSAPSGEVGGDLVDVVPLPWLPPSAFAQSAPADRRSLGEGRSGGRPEAWFGYVADVSGHGVSSGVVMGMFKSALRMRLLQRGPLAVLLADLNHVLFPLKSGSMFVTLSCVRWEEPDLEYAVAGHLPILRVRQGAHDAEEITTLQIPIAMFEDYPFTSAALTCERGDLLALITDGLTEVFDARDRELGIERVKEILVASAARPLRAIADEIVAAARAHGRQIDDQTLLLIRRR